MNYLGHLFLARRQSSAWIGQLAGDFVKGKVGSDIDPDVARAIAAHRSIDSFTDHHPETLAFRKLLPRSGRYAPIVADVLFDHFLTLGWDDYSKQPLEEFLEAVWTALDPNLALMPDAFRAIYPKMRDKRWLLANGSVEGVQRTINRISLRLKRVPDLHDCALDLAEHREQLALHFRRFFPDAIEFAATL